MTPAVRPTLEMERRLWRQGHQWVAGIDEVGRGAWAGPLSVGVAVVHTGLRSRSIPLWLRDSKALAEDRREHVFGQVANWCADAAVGHATPDECDRYGMTLAWRLAAYRALATLEVRPDAIVLDGPWDLLRGPRPKAAAGTGSSAEGGDEPEQAKARTAVSQLQLELGEGPSSELDVDAMDADAAALDAALLDAAALAGCGDAPAEPGTGGVEACGAAPGPPGAPGPPPREWNPPLPSVLLPDTVLPKIRADATCAAVAAASVLAKVVRDRWMREEAEHYPAYGFERNKGYPSTRHQIALRGYGLSAIHRRSWAFVADLPWR